MKAIALNTEAQVFGEIQQNQVAIDASNMNKILKNVLIFEIILL